MRDKGNFDTMQFSFRQFASFNKIQELIGKTTKV